MVRRCPEVTHLAVRRRRKAEKFVRTLVRLCRENSKMKRLDGPVALVTGAEIALRYALEGVTVVVTFLDTARVEGVAREARRHGVKAEAFATDAKRGDCVAGCGEVRTARRDDR